MKSEKVPLVRIQSKHSPQDAAASALKSHDFKSFSAILDQIEESIFPLPDDHWINQPIENDGKTFLIYSMEDVDDAEFCRKLVHTGSNANQYDTELDLGPIHAAVFAESVEKVRALIENPKNKADINCPIQNSGQTPIHLAAEKGLDEILEVLLTNENQTPNVDARDSFGAQTPLYLAAKNKHEECVKLLLSKGADVNIRCGKDKLTLRQTINNKLPHFDLTSPTAYQRQAFIKKTPEDLNKMLESRQLFSFKNGLKFVKPDSLSETVISGMTLLQRACSEGLPDFVEELLKSGVDPNFSKSKTMRPVLLAADNGQHEVLEVLKQNLSEKTGSKPVRFDVWSEKGAETVLHLVLKKSLLRAMQGGVGTEKQIKEIEKRYYDCLTILLAKDDSQFAKQMRLIVNKRDDMGNTPLHYATTSGWSQGIVRQLLNLGANIGVKNWRDEIPLSRITPQTLSDFLDEECLEASGDLDADDGVEVTFKYSFLAPPVSEDQLAKWDPEQQAELEREALPETNCVWYMSRSPGHRHLVTHPVVTSFLWLKWQRIRRFFNLNLRFYTLFVACLTWYIFARFAGHNWNGRVIHLVVTNENDTSTSPVDFCSDILSDERGQRYGFWYGAFVFHCVVQLYLVIRDWLKDAGCCLNCKCNYSSFCAGWIDLFMVLTMALVLWGASGILWLALSCLLALMALRELFQMLSSFRRYLISVENWIEMALVVLVFILVHVPEDSLEDGCNAKRCLAAIAILLSWAELITMVGRHPRLSLYNKYVTMFYRVLRSFFSFLIWYAFFLAAFGLGFYIMLHNDTTPDRVVKEDDFVFFDSPWLALVKTSTMFIGELEFSDIPVDRDSSVRAVLGYLFLLAFVFLIVVVLMNLLNGLAVSDTAAIEREAEIICHVSKAETISYAESVLLGDPFDFLADWTSTKRGCRMSASVYSAFPAIRNFAQKLTGATGILLFYSYLDEKQVVMPLNPDKLDEDCCYELGCRRSSKMAEKMRTDTECRAILWAARKIIGDRRSKQQQSLEENKLEELVRQMLDEQQNLKQMLKKQNDELAEIRKTLK